MDPERDYGLRAKFGIEPQDLLGKLGGKRDPRSPETLGEDREDP
jgi:hypothetical protein